MITEIFNIMKRSFLDIIINKLIGRTTNNNVVIAVRIVCDGRNLKKNMIEKNENLCDISAENSSRSRAANNLEL